MQKCLGVNAIDSKGIKFPESTSNWEMKLEDAICLNILAGKTTDVVGRTTVYGRGFRKRWWSERMTCAWWNERRPSNFIHGLEWMAAATVAIQVGPQAMVDYVTTSCRRPTPRCRLLTLGKVRPSQFKISLIMHIGHWVKRRDIHVVMQVTFEVNFLTSQREALCTYWLHAWHKVHNVLCQTKS